MGQGRERLLRTLSLAASLAALVALEGAARLLPRPTSSDLAELHRYSEIYGWEPRPGARIERLGALTTINWLGYRGREVSAQPAAGVTRVELLGDSIAFGIGVSDEATFGSLLDRGPLEVVNLAVEGYGPDQSLLRLQHEGLSFHPAVVVMNLCLENDFADVALPRFLYDGVHSKPYFRLRSGHLELHDSHLRLSGLQRLGLLVRERSRLAELMAAMVVRPVRGREHWLDRRERATADADAVVGLVGALLRRMSESADAAGARFMVLVHPDEIGYRPHSPWINALLRCPTLEGTTIVDLRARYREHGLRFSDIAIDPTGHLNARGHREAAAILREVLEEVRSGDLAAVQ